MIKKNEHVLVYLKEHVLFMYDKNFKKKIKLNFEINSKENGI